MGFPENTDANNVAVVEVSGTVVEEEERGRTAPEKARLSQTAVTPDIEFVDLFLTRP